MNHLVSPFVEYQFQIDQYNSNKSPLTTNDELFLLKDKNVELSAVEALKFSKHSFF